jgi:hypothetical protein
MEKAGKPAVGIVAVGFERNAMSTARAFGLPHFRYALVREVMTGLTPQKIEEEVEHAFEQMVQVLTTDAAGSESATGRQLKRAEVVRIEGGDACEAIDRMNRHYLEQEWGDGFPLVAPTPRKVEQMLKGTTLSPDDLVTVMAPGSGLATVEKIAINAVMAGCEPAHLPILIAMCEAYTAIGDKVRALAMSTSSFAPLVIINGPIAKELGINSKQCAMGPGLQSRHNIAIGRALRLMMINIGNCRPGRMDMDTIGSARKFSMCVAENEEESPWEPFHVEKGFDRDASMVTVIGTRDEIDVNDLNNFTPEGVLNSFAFYGAIPGGEYLEKIHAGEDPGYPHLLMMGPEHANICGKAGWSKKAVREYVFRQCQISARRLFNKSRNAPGKVRAHWKWLLKLSESELEQLIMPVVENANDFEIVVVGGPAGKNMIYRCMTRASTVEIRNRARS